MSPESRRAVGEVLALFALATLLAAVCYHAQGIGVVRRNLHALVALIFLALPQIALRKRGNIERYGFTLQPLRLGLSLFAAATLVVLPLFAGGFVLAFRFLCAHWPLVVPGSCFRVFHPVWRLPS